MAFAVWIKQSGEGCDYSIGCGNQLFSLSATTQEDAVEEAKALIEENTHSESTIETATLMVVLEDLSAHGEVARLKYLDQRETEKRAAKREQLEKLKRELGE